MLNDLQVFARGLAQMRARLVEYREQCEKAGSEYTESTPDPNHEILAKRIVDGIMMEVIDALITSSDPRHARQVMMDAIRNEKLPPSERDAKLIDTAVDEALRKAAFACEQQGPAPHALPNDLVAAEAEVVRTCVRAIHGLVGQPKTRSQWRDKILRIANEK